MSLSIFVTGPVPDGSLDILKKYFDPVDVYDVLAPLPHDRLLEEAALREGLIIISGDMMNAEIFDHAPRLKAVATNSIGTEHIDFEAATRNGVQVTNLPPMLKESVADLTWALILGVARRVVEGDRTIRAGKWTGQSTMFMLGTDVHGKTLGIYGAGQIGTAVARRARGFDMPILYYARDAKPELEDLGAERVPFEELLSRSDFLSLHVPLTPETRHRFGEEEFKQMKPTAFFINIARGPVHDEAALVKALKEKWIAGAGLDVFENEPDVHPDLMDMPNVHLLPHAGSATLETRTRMVSTAANNLTACLLGEPCENLLNPEVLER